MKSSSPATTLRRLSLGDELEFPVFFDYQRLAATPALVGTYAGSFARSQDQLSPDQVIDAALSVLKKVYGPNIPTPTDAAVTNWLNDPFSRGSYTSIPLRARSTDPDLLAAPVRGRVLFAGEASSRERYGYADGALTTGIREAKRLLQAPSVYLSAQS